jgi:hypothetical protein
MQEGRAPSLTTNLDPLLLRLLSMSMRRFRSVDVRAYGVDENKHRQGKSDHKKHFVKRNAHLNRESDHHRSANRFEEIRPFHNSFGKCALEI